MKIKQILQEYIPSAYYLDGTEANCWIYKVCNMFDIDSYSFKQVKIKECMDEKKEEETKVTLGKINHYISDNTEEN